MSDHVPVAGLWTVGWVFADEFGRRWFHPIYFGTEAECDAIMKAPLGPAHAVFLTSAEPDPVEAYVVKQFVMGEG